MPSHRADFKNVLRALGRTIERDDAPGHNPFTAGLYNKLRERYARDHGKQSVAKSTGKHSEAMVPQDHVVMMAMVLAATIPLVRALLGDGNWWKPASRCMARGGD